MPKNIAQLNPTCVWQHFSKLCEIPRPSHHEQGVIDYIQSIAETAGLSHNMDTAGNLIVRKAATAGKSHCHGIVIQGHLDMVGQASKPHQHNFETDPINAYIDGAWVTAKHTTLGADNGIGVACALAVLTATDITHPPIEALFTINEESGMSGALGLQPDSLQGDWLLNIDTEEVGELYVGCAGGKDIIATIPLETEPSTPTHTAYMLTVSELKGGHSGIDIHRGRANANKLTNTLLQRAQTHTDIRVAAFNGGSLRNAIPRDANTHITLPNAQVSTLHQIMATYTDTIRTPEEPDIRIQLTPAERPDQVFTPAFLTRLLSAIEACPNGVEGWIPSLPNVVETSNNLARIFSDQTDIHIEALTRSAVETKRDALCERIAEIFRNIGSPERTHVHFSNAYPGWEPDMDSPLLQLMKTRHHALYGNMPEINVIHAGLECGVLGAVYPHWKMISFGPTIQGAHSPDERVRIEDVGLIWDYLVDVLAHIPEQPSLPEP